MSSYFLKFVCCINTNADLYLTPLAKKEENLSDKKEYWQNELKSLGIESKRQNELNDKEELEALAEMIKEVYYQDYKAAYT